MKKALFLDRDGTLIIDAEYLSDPNKVELIPDTAVPLRELSKKGYLLIIITNQSGIARGMFTEDDMHTVNRKLCELFRAEDVEFDDILFCPHAPEDNCECRKPSPKLIKDAAEKFDIDLAKSAMIGDKISDAECGIAAGCSCNIFLDNGKQPAPTRKDISIAKNMREAVRIVNRES